LIREIVKHLQFRTITKACEAAQETLTDAPPASARFRRRDAALTSSCRIGQNHLTDFSQTDSSTPRRRLRRILEHAEKALFRRVAPLVRRLIQSATDARRFRRARPTAAAVVFSAAKLRFAALPPQS
jgi:hypothetical protein